MQVYEMSRGKRCRLSNLPVEEKEERKRTKERRRKEREGKKRREERKEKRHRSANMMALTFKKEYSSTERKHDEGHLLEENERIHIFLLRLQLVGPSFLFAFEANSCRIRSDEKKNNEVFDFKCQVCFVATQVCVVGRKRKTKKKVDAQLTEPSAKRVRPEQEPTQQQRSPREAYTRPSAIVLSSRTETRFVVASSTPMDLSPTLQHN